MQVEYFSNEKSIKQKLRIYFLKNKRSSKLNCLSCQELFNFKFISI